MRIGRVEKLQFKEEIIAAAERTGIWSELGRVEYEVELAWTLLDIPISSSTGRIRWKAFFLGKMLFERLGEAQNWRCCYCGIRMLEDTSGDHLPTLEHIDPYARSVSDHPDNLVIACDSCNQRRGDQHHGFEEDLLLSLP